MPDIDPIEHNGYGTVFEAYKSMEITYKSRDAKELIELAKKTGLHAVVVHTSTGNYPVVRTTDQLMDMALKGINFNEIPIPEKL